MLYLPQLLAKVWTFAVFSAVPRADSTWGMCSKHCNTSNLHVQVLQNLMVRWHPCWCTFPSHPEWNHTLLISSAPMAIRHDQVAKWQHEGCSQGVQTWMQVEAGQIHRSS